MGRFLLLKWLYFVILFGTQNLVSSAKFSLITDLEFDKSWEIEGFEYSYNETRYPLMDKLKPEPDFLPSQNSSILVYKSILTIPNPNLCDMRGKQWVKENFDNLNATKELVRYFLQNGYSGPLSNHSMMEVQKTLMAPFEKGPSCFTPVISTINFKAHTFPEPFVNICVTSSEKFFTSLLAKSLKSEDPIICFSGILSASEGIPLEVASTDKRGIIIFGDYIVRGGGTWQKKLPGFFLTDEEDQKAQANPIWLSLNKWKTAEEIIEDDSDRIWRGWVMQLKWEHFFEQIIVATDNLGGYSRISDMKNIIIVVLVSIIFYLLFSIRKTPRSHIRNFSAKA